MAIGDGERAAPPARTGFARPAAVLGARRAAVGGMA